jgi:UDP-N-acetylmuramate-alanine ligase
VEYTGSIEQTAAIVAEKVRDQDLVLTLGAGSVWQVGERVLEKLREAS